MDVNEALRAAAHFRKLSDEALGQLARGFELRKIDAGASVYEPGQPADALFVIVGGTVVTFRDQDGSRPLARLRDGDIVGVADLFDSEVRHEAAHATEASVLLRGARGDLMEFLTGEPSVELNLRLAAARDLTTRAKVKLAVAHRRVVRHRVNREVELTPSGVGSTPATLIDLSTLGMALRGAPATWRRDDIVRYRLRWHERRLALVGRVAWREAEEAGVELQDPKPEEQLELEAMLEQMLYDAA